MIEMYCDKCKKKVDKITRLEHREDAKAHGVTIASFCMGEYDLCDDCLDKLKTLKLDIKDFMAMSDEEIELALYPFKVGDQVITDDGRVGIIESFCTCPSCKVRGFYEPQIKMEIGDDPIFITDTDKNNGFKYFYKIGDQVYGNINEQCVRDNIYNLKKQLIGYESQLEVIKKLKKEKENEL